MRLQLFLLALLLAGTSTDTQPVDVPTVETPITSEFYMHGDMIACTNGGHIEKPWSHDCVGGHRTTCVDKKRVLLTSEDGVKHCILFPKDVWK